MFRCYRFVWLDVIFHIRDRPFNLKGFLFFVFCFLDNTRVRIFIFLDKNSESDYFCFPPATSTYFFHQHWESEYFFRNKAVNFPVFDRTIPKYLYCFTHSIASSPMTNLSTNKRPVLLKIIAFVLFILNSKHRSLQYFSKIFNFSWRPSLVSENIIKSSAYNRHGIYLLFISADLVFCYTI